MGYTKKLYGDNHFWNMLPSTNSNPLSPAELQVTSHGPTVVQVELSVGNVTAKAVGTGNFQFQEPALTAAQVSGTISSASFYLNGEITEYESWSTPVDIALTYSPTFATQMSWLVGDDVFVASQSYNLRDWVRSESGNDKFTGYGDEQDGDYFYGGSGIDTSVYRGRASDYSITTSNSIWDCIKNDGSRLSGFVVTDKTAGRDGIDNLVDVERLKFDDTHVALDYQAGGHAGQAYRLYKGVLGREGEPGGLGYVMNRLDQGETLKNVASGYLNSPEFLAKYGNADQPTFINLLYQNILGRAADASGTTFINNWMASGATREDVALGFTESPEYIAQCITLIGNSGIHYNPAVS